MAQPPAKRLVTESTLDSVAASAVSTSGSATRTALDGRYALASATTTSVTQPTLKGTTGIAMYCVSSAYTTSQMQAWKNQGGTHVLLQVFWDRWQTSQGGAMVASAVQEFQGWLSNARSVGLRVITEIDVAAPPAWFKSAAPRFKQQGGTEFTGYGDSIRDFVFSTVTRGFYQDFITKAFAALTSSDLALIDVIRVGGGPVDELNYPPPHAVTADGSGWDWWLFSAAAQAGTNRVSSISAPPAANRYPGQGVAAGTAWSSADDTLNAWYQSALVDFMVWWINLHRSSGWQGLLSILHPSWGLRPSRGTGDSVYRNESAQGTDWVRQVAAYPDTRCIPWCTWMERTPDGSDDGNISPAQYLAKVAQNNGDQWGLLGENAGNTSDADTSALFTNSTYGPLQALGYRGLMWVSYDSLTGGGSGQETLSQLGSKMQAKPADANKIQGASNAAGAATTIDGSQITSGLISPSRLGTGVASSSTFLRGDGAWASPPTSSGNQSAVALPFTYLATPSGGDDTSAIQAALDAFDNTSMPGVKFQDSNGAFQNGAQANGGGTVMLGPGVWTASQIVLAHRQRLVGSGWTTVLRQKAGTSGHFITNQRDGSVHAQYVEIRDIQLDGNKANQSATNHGIYLLGDKTNTYNSPLDEDYDINNYVNHVYVRGFKGYGIYMDGSGENIVSDFKILRCDAGGLYTFQDNYIVNGTIGWSGADGLVMAGDDCRITNVKCWYSTGRGFYVTADSGCLTGCSAQDNQQQGLLLDSAFGVNVSGFMADSNSRNNSGTYYQVDIYNSQFCVINAVARNRYNANGPGTKGLQHAGGSTNNDIVFIGAASPWGVTTPYTGTKNASYIRVNGVAQ